MLLQERPTVPTLRSEEAPPRRHPLPVRIAHWTSALAILGLATTGTLIFTKHFRHAAQPIHYTLAAAIIITGITYLAFTLRTGRWRAILPKRDSLQDAWRVLLHDLGIKQHAIPADSYNGAQRIAYTTVIILASGEVLTGIALFFGKRAAPLVHLLGGKSMIVREHIGIMLAILAFIAVHVIQVIRAGQKKLRLNEPDRSINSSTQTTRRLAGWGWATFP